MYKKYDKKNNKIEEKWPDGSKYFFKYDKKGRRVEQICPNGFELYRILYEYDDNDNLINVTFLTKNNKIIKKRSCLNVI